MNTNITYLKQKPHKKIQPTTSLILRDLIISLLPPIMYVAYQWTAGGRFQRQQRAFSPKTWTPSASGRSHETTADTSHGGWRLTTTEDSRDRQIISRTTANAACGPKTMQKRRRTHHPRQHLLFLEMRTRERAQRGELRTFLPRSWRIPWEAMGFGWENRPRPGPSQFYFYRLNETKLKRYTSLLGKLF